MNQLATPEDVLDYWLGETPEKPETLTERNALWFAKSFKTDSEIADRFVETLSALANGLCEDWAARGPRERLAAIIVLDQFSRNIFRGHRFSFTHDRLARELMQAGLEAGEDQTLSEPERVFFYLPAEHSEDIADQDLSVRLFQTLTDGARADYKEFCKATLDYAHQHREVIAQFGRFPHRNRALRRASTPEERAYLDKPGAGF